jgi:hypothetical protein
VPIAQSNDVLCWQMAQATLTRWNELAAHLNLDVTHYAESATSLLSCSAALDEDLLGFNGGSSDAH